MRLLFVGLCALLTSCSNGPSHIPAPWQLPGAAAGTVIENATYGRRRSRVKNFVRENWAPLQMNIDRGGGVVMENAFDLARIETAKRIDILTEIKTHPEIYRVGSLEDKIEMLTVTLMVHGR